MPSPEIQYPPIMWFQCPLRYSCLMVEAGSLSFPIEKQKAWRVSNFIFKDVKQKLHFSFSLISHWLKPSHKTIPSYKGYWKMYPFS